MLVNICVKFHVGIFLSYRADTTILQNQLFSISKGHNSKNMQSRVTVLVLCTLSHVALHLCKVSFKISQTVFELQSVHNFDSRKIHVLKEIAEDIIW